MTLRKSLGGGRFEYRAFQFEPDELEMATVIDLTPRERKKARYDAAAGIAVGIAEKDSWYASTPVRRVED